MADKHGRSMHEIVVNDNPPSTDQLFRLASHAMVAAHATRTHRMRETMPRAHFGKHEVRYDKFVTTMTPPRSYSMTIRHESGAC